MEREGWVRLQAHAQNAIHATKFGIFGSSLLLIRCQPAESGLPSNWIRIWSQFDRKKKTNLIINHRFLTDEMWKLFVFPTDAERSWRNFWFSYQWGDRPSKHDSCNAHCVAVVKLFRASKIRILNRSLVRPPDHTHTQWNKFRLSWKRIVWG